jgi:hypothetical protein
MDVEIFFYWPLKADISWFLGVCRQLYVLQDWRDWGFAFWVISVETGKRLGFSSVIIELFLVIQKKKKKDKERKLSCSVLREDKIWAERVKLWKIWSYASEGRYLETKNWVFSILECDFLECDSGEMKIFFLVRLLLFFKVFFIFICIKIIFFLFSK